MFTRMGAILRTLWTGYFLFSSILYGDDASGVESIQELLKQPYVAISLGANCMPALHAKHHGIQSYSFPFDWNVTPFEVLCSIIRDDFRDFCELRYLHVGDPGRSDVVANTKHGFKIHHLFNTADWTNGPQGLTPLNERAVKHFEEIKSAFQRRIERFKAVLSSGNPVYLFRYEDINQSQAQRLYNLIKEKYPSSNCFLVCLDEFQRKGERGWKSDNDRIYHFYLNPKGRPITDSTKDRPHASFTRVFSELGLL